MLLALAVGTSAQAAITHPYTGVSFGPAGVASGSFGSTVGVAVQQSTGDVFVLDSAEGGRVYKFDAAGEPVDFSSSATNVIEGVGSAGAAEEEIAVDDSKGPDAGDVYVANNQAVRIYAASGAFLGELSGGEMCGVAVDPSGSVYVGIYPETVRRYAPASNPVTNAQENGSMAGLAGVCNVAADSEGSVYAASFGGGVTKYVALQFGSLSATGTAVDSGGRTLAVDPLGTDVFIDKEGDVAQYDGSAEPPTLLGTSGSGELSGSLGVAVDHASGKLYAASGGTVGIFGPGVVIASATTEAATGVTGTEATLHGTVEPSGTEVTECIFDYGTERGALNQSRPCSPGAPYTGSAPVAVTAQLTGLQPGTTYRYRIVANGGSTGGEERAFTTAGPIISNEEAQRSEIKSNGARMRAQVDPVGEATKYHVEYGTTTAYGSNTPTVELEAGESPVAVVVDLRGLQPLTTYHFRFVAENPSGTTFAPDSAFTTNPIVSKEDFSEVGSSSAALSSEIDPGGEETTYTVEYGLSTAYGSSTQPVSVGSGETAVGVVTRLEGLAPESTYHFRFVAVKSAGSEAGPDVTFTTHRLSTPGLPDERGYEMVTPADNEGGEPYSPAGAGQEHEDAIFTRYVSVAAANGEAVAYAGTPTSSGNGNQGNGGGNQFLAKRNPGGGWTQADIQPTGYISPTYWAFSPNLEDGILTSYEAVTPGGTAGYADLYARNDEEGTYQPLSSVTPPNRSIAEFGAPEERGFTTEHSMGEHYAGASADFTHLLFEANDALTSDAVDPGREANNLYESVDGQLSLVNVLPGGTSAPDASFGSAPVNGTEAQDDVSHVISADGSRIFWTDRSTGSLYVRENATSTALIAEGATYLTASSDGSKVLYTKEGDLYEDDLGTEVTRDLTPGGQVLGLVGASEDLEYIYLVSEASLASGATAGQPNLFLMHGATTRFIATFGSAREEYVEVLGYEVYPWQPDAGWRTAEVTPSGKGLVFMSRKSLTGYDNVSSSEGGRIVAPEVYDYDADSGQISCVSCDPTGERPSGEIGLERFGGLIPISRHNAYQQHVISDDGNRVFFESVHPLLPQAQNGRLDVYEWERDGAGSCSYASGCVYLVSDPSTSTPSYLIDASASGNDVFFMTRTPLVPSDKNEYNDIYDARVGVKEAASPTQCTGTGCQGAPASPPVFATPASVTFSGVGNYPPTAKATVKPKPKPKPKPKKKSQKCAAKKKQKHKGKKSAKQAKAKPTVCKSKKAAKPARHSKSGRGGR